MAAEAGRLGAPVDLMRATARLPRDELIALRRWRADDVTALAEACADAEVQRWTLVPGEYTEADGRDFVAATAEGLHAGASCELAAVDAADPGTVLGSIGLMRIEWGLERAEVGYWTRAEARGRGVASRAVRLLSGWAFAELGLARLQLTPYLGNAASERVALRAGYSREGVLRRYFRSKAGLVDVVMYSRLRDDD